MPTLYNWKIGGEAGYGITNTGGPIFAKTLVRAGFFVFIYSEYPSLIRGGHNTMQVAIAKEEVSGAYLALDQLIALNTNTVVWHQGEVKSGGVIMYDPNVVKFKEDGYINNDRIPPLTGSYSIARAKAPTKKRDDITYIPVEFEKIAEEIGGNKLMRNVAAIGASLAVFASHVPHEADIIEIGRGVLADIFGSKGDKVVQPNQAVIEAGYKAAGEVEKLKSGARLS